MKHLEIASLVFASALACVAMTATHASAQNATAPYAREPLAGDSVRLDGTLGGAKTAWAYVDRHWLERYLQVTIDAAAANRSYTDTEVQNNLASVANHVTPIPDGTLASVEAVQQFTYNGRADTEVRVMIAQGPMRGRELWTTCAELVDASGHSFLHT